MVASVWGQTPQQPVVGAPLPETPAPGTPAPDPPRTVRIDAIVTDKQGKPVVNLRASDFKIVENGIEQKIDAITLSSAPAASAPVEPIETEQDEERAAREQGSRVIGLYLDEFHVSPASNERVREAATRFIGEHLRPGDLLVVLRPLDHLTAIRFTRNRDDARRSIAAFDGRKDDYTPRTAFEEQYMGRSPEAVRAARAQIVMSGLRALVQRMGELDASTSAIVLVSEGFSSAVPRSRERRLPDLQGLVRAANRYRVVLYSFDPAFTAAPAPPPPPAADGDADGSSTASASTVSSLAQLREIALETGGSAATAGDDLMHAFEGIGRDLNAYYVLTYKTTTVSDGRFHKLEITSARRDAQVRSRNGYWAPMPEIRASRVSSSLPPLAQMRAVRRSPLIDSWFGVTIDPGGQRRVIFTWSPAARPVRTAKPGSRPDLVALKVTTPGGAVLFEGEVSAARGATVSGQRTDSAVFNAAPGRLQFDLTIFQADGTKLDVGSQDYDLPEVKPGNPVILPLQMFRAASAREVRDITGDAGAAPLPGREFRRTDTMILRVPTFDPSGARVQVSAKLINPVGTVLTELTPVSAEPTALTQFDLPLARFAPGEYSIEVAARSDSGIARELIRVRITG